MLWGYFQKVIIADRIAVIVSKIYDNYSEYPGVYILAATILFAFQVYCDFGGYSNIAIGAARILGFELMENFNAPYRATSVADFWSRWHISLSQWLRDYVYIPLGGNRLGKKRKCTNLLCTFLISGIWHGANWSYVVWGVLHGVYRVVEEVFRDKVPTVLKKCPQLLRQFTTFVFVDFAWLFFRANSISDAFNMIGRMFTKFQLPEMLNRELAISFGLEIFGYYGPGFDAAQFIYFQF